MSYLYNDSIKNSMSPDTDQNIINQDGSIPSNWSRHISENGRPYYFNSITGQSQWNLLDDAAERIPRIPRTYNIELVGATGVGKTSFIERILSNTFNPRYRP